jgi:hypothetical protein
MTAITINFNNVVKLNDDQFYQLCRDNPDIKFERKGDPKNKMSRRVLS